MLENIWQVLSKYVVLRIMKPIELGVRNYQKGKILKYMSQIFSLQTKLNTTIGISIRMSLTVHFIFGLRF